MLCLALSEGWPTRGYHAPDHPVQRLMRETVAELCGLAPPDLVVAVDGCNVSVFALPLRAMARGYARWAAADPRGNARERALSRIRSAMQAFPRAVGGEGRLSTAIMEATRSRLVAKGGAEGLECLAVPAARLGIAVKCEDGQSRAMGPAVVALLEHLGELSPGEVEALAEWRSPVVRNAAGHDVGRIEATVRAPAPVAS
jgi:L-asparaginase II